MDYREKIAHGNEGFPIAVYEIEPEHERYRMHVHWHPEHEILHVHQGILHLRLNDTLYHLKAGDVIFIAGGSIHSGEPENCRYSCILVNLPLLMKKNDSCMDVADGLRTGTLKILPILGEAAHGFSSLCTEMSRIYEQKREGYLFEMKGLIFCFFGRILNEGHYSREVRDKTNDAMSARMKVAIAFMEENYETPIKLAELARLASMSPNHFCRCFKAVTGTTPFAYLIAYRLSNACYALKNTDHPITSIALDNGFNDVSHFIRLFRETYGMTPKQYRKAEMG